jgi:hypothetical protein
MGMVAKSLILMVSSVDAAQKVALRQMAGSATHLTNARLFENLDAALCCEVVIFTSAVMLRFANTMGDGTVSIRRNTSNRSRGRWRSGSR